MEQWVYKNKVEWHFMESGKRMENVYVERFNVSFREECVNENWFLGLKEER